TNGSRIVLEARTNGVLMGQETAAADRRPRLTLVVKGTEPLRRATLIRDGNDLQRFTFEGDGKDRGLEFTDETAAAGVHWYYWRVEQAGLTRHYGGNVSLAIGNLAWSTPNWVRVP